MKVKLTMMVLVMLVAFPAAAQAFQADPEAEGLVKYEDAKVDIAYILPGVDWNKYKTIYLSPLRVTPEARDATPDRLRTRSYLGGSWILDDRDVRVMVEAYDKIMRKELGERGGFTFVDEPQMDSLIIVAAIVDIYLSVPIERTRRGATGRGGVYDQIGGGMTLSAVLGDPETNLVIARAVDTRYPTAGLWSENSRVRNIGDMRQVFRAWARNFRKRLIGFQTGKIASP